MSSPTKLRAIEIINDPSPNGIINQRIFKHFLGLTSYTDLTKSEIQLFMHLLLLQSKKLISVWIHLDRYITIEKGLINKFLESNKSTNDLLNQFELSQDLFIEFDEFLVQIKSSLDYLVKIPIPILGREKWNLTTFGKKGEVVINALRNVPETYEKKANNIIKRVFEKNKLWLQDTIDARDKINHYLEGCIPFQNFSVFCDTNGSISKIHVPIWVEKQTIKEFMEIVWENLFKFMEDFIAMFLFLRAKPNISFFHGLAEIDSPQSPWLFIPKEEMEKVIKKPGWELVKS